MPAYLSAWPLRTCGWSGCMRQATHTLYNTFNAPVADYCRRHGRMALHKWWHENPDQRPKDWDAAWRAP